MHAQDRGIRSGNGRCGCRARYRKDRVMDRVRLAEEEGNEEEPPEMLEEE